MCSKCMRRKLPLRTWICYTGIFHSKDRLIHPLDSLRGDTISLDTGIASYNGPDLLLETFFSFRLDVFVAIIAKFT